MTRGDETRRTRQLQVGPLRLAVCADPDIAGLAALCAPLQRGFEQRRLGAERVVEVSLVPHPAEPSGCSAVPRFIWDAELGAYTDGSEIWDARIGVDGARAEVSARLVELELQQAALAWLLRAVCSVHLPLHGAVLVHGSALISPTSGHAMLFVGPSGAGKSTMCERLPDWPVLADDTACVRRAAGGWTVTGTPFYGKERRPRRDRPTRLERIVVLEPHASRPELSPVGVSEAFEAMMQRVMCLVRGGPAVAATADLVERLARDVPVVRLASSLEHEVASVLRAPLAEVA